MVGFPFELLHTVLAEHLFLLNMLYLALKVGYHPFDIMKYKILLTEVCSQVAIEPEFSGGVFSVYC